MKTTAPTNITPTLLFPGFSVVWEEKKLGSVLKVGSGRDHKNLKDGNIPVFGTGGYMRSVDKVLHSGETVFIGRKGTINKPFYFKGDFWTVDTLFYTHDFKNTTAIFVKYIFDQINWLKYNEASGVPSLSKNTIEKIKISLPEIEEQNKIADFLSGVDEWIDNLKKQKENLESYKKGMMQKIFSQEMRFKDENGKDFTEWEEKRLGEYISLSSHKNKENIHSRILSVSNKKGFISQEEQFEDHRIASADVKNYKIVEKNDFAYNPSRINVGSIARLINFESGLVSPMYVVFKLKKSLDNVFFESFTDTHYFKYLVKINCSGSVRDSLNFDDLETFKVNFPKMNEQQEIARFLGSVDNMLELKQKQIVEAEGWKKGVMQGVFI